MRTRVSNFSLRFWRVGETAWLPRPARKAFTLVELLVSMVVLLLIVLSVAGMVNSVSQTTTADRRHLEADNEARRVFDRMAADFGRMVKRSDADTIFASIKGADTTHGANDKMFFYSDAPAYYAASPSPAPAQSMVGLIGYRIPNDMSDQSEAGNRWQLERLGKGLTWDLPTATSTPGAVVFLTYPAASPSPAPTPTPFPASTLAGAWGTAAGLSAPTALGTGPNYDDGLDANYHVLSNQVFRMEYCFVLKNATATNQFVTSITPGKGFREVSAIVVALALLDARGRSQMSSVSPMSALAAALPDPDFTTNPPGKLMAEVWNAKIKVPSFATTLGIPQAVASQIRVYQRYFYLNTP